MAFFGFDTTLPRDRPNQHGASRGMFDSHDPFAGLGENKEEEEILDFEQTYDGLGQQLDESGDVFNDDTFGDGAPVTRASVGRDFDFAGQTAKVRDTLLEEQVLHHARQPIRQTFAPQKQVATGYEAYKQPEYIPKLEADASIWGKPMGKSTEPEQPAHDTYAGRKMMSLEEVEAMMRTQPKATAPPSQQMDLQSQGLRAMLGVGPPPVQYEQQQSHQHLVQAPDYTMHAPQILQRQHAPQQIHAQSQSHLQQAPWLNQVTRQGPGMPAPAVQPPQAIMHPNGGAQHQRGPSFVGPPMTQAHQVSQLAPEDREAYLAEEARRAKRNHKIFLLSKNNGLMTPQDKNFITRIQLQQLLTATGGVEHGPGSEEQLAEDFYYQVYAQIRGPPRSGPGQPLNQFAQTYLFQTGNRYGYGRSRHHPRGADNHVQRMEQQVARAVEAAKARPKNKHLVVEGSLGKIAFSNSKTPRPLLNLKRLETARTHTAKHTSVADRKAALRDIEHMYSVLMKLEDHERKLPAPPNEDSPPEIIERHMTWQNDMQILNQELWEAMKVMEPIQANPSVPHPFIQILAHAKGKKAIPRVFRHLDEQQRLTMLTLIVIHLDFVDVIRDGYPPVDGTPLTPRVKEEIQLFDQAVMPPLFSYVNEAPLHIIIGLLGLITDRTHVQSIVRTKIGISILTMLVSRAELVKQAVANSPAHHDDWQQWSELYGRLFDVIEPVLPYIFPTDTNISASEDVHVWQFLAAMGVGASPDQQQRLVIGVKDRVMETVGICKTLPEDMAQRRSGDVNLFMRAIGLDVELLG